MKFLLCCEFYYPSLGGVQEVMRQIAERLVRKGHEVTVATTKLPNRVFTSLNGVQFEEFSVKGNLVRSIEGDVKSYQDFVKNFVCDAILIKAAQQWTFDALWPVLKDISARKVFIPCGFSGLFDPEYKEYFEKLPQVLHQFDHLIFYANHYRDTDFARKIGYERFTILPNGASEIEFSSPHKTDFRERYGIPGDSFLLLTVGTLTGTKGHREVAEAFAELKVQPRHVSLILNGNSSINIVLDENLEGGSKKISGQLTKYVFRINKKFNLYINFPRRALKMYRSRGWSGTKLRASIVLRKLIFGKDPLGINQWARKINQDPHKKLLQLDLPRAELIEAYNEANLFVFASNIEYSPLVLFEAAAAGTPFLSVPVGNAEEIARWTQGGVICQASKSEVGFTHVDPKHLAKEIEVLINSPELLDELGKRAKFNWDKYFRWDKIVDQYEDILLGKNNEQPSFLME